MFTVRQGGISETLTYDGDERGKYDFALSFDERHGENDAEHLKMGEKLMDEKRMKVFHRIVLDMDYRKELLEEVE